MVWENTNERDVYICCKQLAVRSYVLPKEDALLVTSHFLRMAQS